MKASCGFCTWDKMIIEGCPVQDQELARSMMFVYTCQLSLFYNITLHFKSVSSFIFHCGFWNFYCFLYFASKYTSTKIIDTDLGWCFLWETGLLAILACPLVENLLVSKSIFKETFCRLTFVFELLFQNIEDLLNGFWLCFL